MAEALAATAISFSKASATGFWVCFGGFFVVVLLGFCGAFCSFVCFLIASTMQVNCKTVIQVLSDYGHPTAQSNLVREPRCHSTIAGKEVAGHQA